LVEELREISYGLHPAVLSAGGLRPAIKSLARRSMPPVTLAIGVGRRLPESVDADDDTLRLVVRDDGVGGATSAGGSGLIGLKDRGSVGRPAYYCQSHRRRYLVDGYGPAARAASPGTNYFQSVDFRVIGTFESSDCGSRSVAPAP
jgi:hypothetical protein